MNSSSNPLRVILGELPVPPLLTHAEEIELARRVAAGQAAVKRLPTALAKSRAALRRAVTQGHAAREALVLHNLPLVVSVATRYRGSHLAQDDLIQEGMLGLMKAADRYDPQRGTRFATLAVWWIRQSIGRAVANTGRTVRLPVNRAWRLGQLRRAAARLAQELGTQPEVSQMAQAAGLPIAMAEALLREGQAIVSLDAPPSDDDRALLERIADPATISPEVSLLERSLREALEKSLARLEEREAQVLRWRFGLEGGQALALRAIASAWKMSPEGVRQISERAMSRLRAMPDVGDLQVYLED